MSTIPGGKTGSVAPLTATFATAVTLTGGVNKGPTTGNWVNGLAQLRACNNRVNKVSIQFYTVGLLLESRLVLLRNNFT